MCFNKPINIHYLNSHQGKDKTASSEAWGELYLEKGSRTVNPFPEGSVFFVCVCVWLQQGDPPQPLIVDMAKERSFSRDQRLIQQRKYLMFTAVLGQSLSGRRDHLPAPHTPPTGRREAPRGICKVTFQNDSSDRAQSTRGTLETCFISLPRT